MRLAMVLFLIDLFTKLLAVEFSPNNSMFKLIYNKEMLFGKRFIFGIEFTDFLKIYLCGAIILPVFLLFNNYLLKNEDPKEKHTALAFLFGGMIGNYWQRLTPYGVVDFINCHFFICNLADIFQWIGFYMIIKMALRQKQELSVDNSLQK